MKVITVITQMEGGGAQNAAIRMAQELRKRGHSTETCFLYMKRPAYASYDHINICRMTPPGSPFDYLKIFLDFVKYIKKEKPDAIIGFTYYANIFGALAGLLAGVRVRIASQRNPSWTYPTPGKVVDRIIGSLGAYTSNIAVSKAVLESFAHYPASYLKKMVVIYNGIPARRAGSSALEARRKYGIPVDKKVVVTTGRLSYQKNHEVLLQAVADLPEVHLAIAGGGELESELKGLRDQLKLQDRVSFVGELLPEDVPDFLAVGDVFVFPSRFEAFGFSVMEAAFAGMPLLVSDIAPLREILDRWEDEQPAALFLPMSEASRWQDAIALVTKDDQALQQLCAAATKRSQYFTLDRMVDGYERLLGE
jgi:glycosyltransferase involved in cell wall biosynthesis